MKRILITLILICCITLPCLNDIYSADKTLSYPIKLSNLKGEEILIYSDQLTVFLKKIGIDNIYGILPLKNYAKIEAQIYRKDHCDITYIDISFKRLSNNKVEIIIKENYHRNQLTNTVKRFPTQRDTKIYNPAIFKTNAQVYTGEGSAMEGVMLHKNKNVFELEVEKRH